MSLLHSLYVRGSTVKPVRLAESCCSTIMDRSLFNYVPPTAEDTYHQSTLTLQSRSPHDSYHIDVSKKFCILRD